ncbi:uncharacterized protein LAJ45_03318 [Morchella importuna]|uniref:uncharacterized protein n=1 Tax=Morchella importuna TaxID=1174673 RepID=UPI001E8D15B2|nr:uncharacterized protein LAJ45_03318 [Morchella importuna]KAH8152478.1 hypothetical protein LAJ45_03318 [Morchella importuna]
MDAQAHCLCGELQWTAHFSKGKMPGQVLCHCVSLFHTPHQRDSQALTPHPNHQMPCKMFGGGEYTVNMMVPKSDVKMTKGTPKVYTYTGESGNPVDCFYCPNCTTHAYHHEKVLGDRYTMHSLLFEDDTLKHRPIEMELFGKHRMPYQPEIAKTYEVTDNS